MRKVLKAVVSATVLLSSGACFSDVSCKEDSDCFTGSFCFNPLEGEGICTLGEWAEDELGAWVVLPKIELHSNISIEKDSSNPKLRKITSDSNRVVPLTIRASGANTIPKPLGSAGVSIECRKEQFQEHYINLPCDLNAAPGKYIIRISAYNGNGKNTLLLEWTKK